MKEEWKDVIGHEGKYAVSNRGYIKRISTGVILKPCVNGSGYHQVNLWKDGKCWAKRIHRAIMEAFVPNPGEKRDVNHINGVKTDNRIENLEWATRSENGKHAHRLGLNAAKKGMDNPTSKLTNNDVMEIKKSIAAKDRKTYGRLAAKFNVSYDTIRSIAIGRIWSHIS